MIGGTTRRGLLATLAATGVAGCSGELPGLGGDREIESRGLPAVDGEDTGLGTTPEFPVSPAFPVSVAAAQFRRHRDRTTALLGELPTPLSAETVPNGHVRAELADAVREATTALADARAAPTERVALQRLRDARVEAGYAAAGWGFATGERELSTARDSFYAVADEAQEARETLEHLAGDPVVATAGYAAVEYLFTRAGDRDTPNAESTLLRVAETGGAVERAHATLADARHLADRLADTGTERHADRIRTAAQRLFERLRERQSAVATPTPNRERSVASEALRAFDRAVSDRRRSVADADGPATALLTGTHQLATLSAFETITERVEAGALDRIESAAWVRRRRAAAVEAVESALGRATAPALARPTVVDAGRRLAYGDRRLARVADRGDPAPARLVEPVTDYVTAETLADAASETSGTAAEALLE